MNPHFRPYPRLDLRSRQLPLSGLDRAVRADRRADGRLYPAPARLRRRSRRRRVQKPHFHAHGTTLAGLMKDHDVDPHDFLGDVHAIPLDRIGPTTGLPRRSHGCRAASSSSPTATRTMPGACSTRSASRPFRRPSRHPRQQLSAQARSARLSSCCASGSASIPAHALLADDMAQNLAPAKALGMTTVWVDNGSERGSHGYRRRLHRLSHRQMSATGSNRS